MKNKRFGMVSIALISTLLSFSLNFPASAWELSSPEQSLKGLKGVHLVITGINYVFEQAGITKVQLRNEIELKLLANGIRIFPEGVAKIEPDAAYLYITVNAMKAPNELYFYSIKTELKQWVSIFRDKNIVVYAPTWSTDVMGITGQPNLQYVVRKGVIDGIEKFGRAFRYVNQQTRQRIYQRYQPYQ